MTLTALIAYLLEMLDKHGNVSVLITTEDDHAQVEQPLGDVAYSPLTKKVILLPEGF